MDSSTVLTLAQNALFILLMVSAPILGAVLVVGLSVSLFQALTQINEATLSFVPKLLAAIVVFATAGPWMLATLVDFIRRTLQAIPTFAA
jgi:flagellar biosynthetic protein FliQ